MMVKNSNKNDRNQTNQPDLFDLLGSSDSSEESQRLQEKSIVANQQDLDQIVLESKSEAVDEDVDESQTNESQTNGKIPPPGVDDGNPEDDPFISYAKKAYLEYALISVKGRALPDVRDGQKPVQRRILYAMKRMGLTATSKPVKSARLVGECLGKYHPHGDTSVYDAAVRMAQEFSLRYPLVDGQGNFGSRDGDHAAAMRYTEVRLSAISSLLLDELDEGTVDWKPTYDATHTEPKSLPARLPFIVLNGASGIAVGMATEIPPHNLKEVAQLAIGLTKNPGLAQDEFYEMFKGPDFPTGSTLITSREDILKAYKEGRGALRLRSKFRIEETGQRGGWRLVIEQLPQGVSSAKVLEEIEDLVNPKIKPNKKSLDADSQQSKTLFSSLLETVRDESGKEHDVRLIFEPKSSKVDKETFTKTLLAHTSLESNYSINLTMVGLDGRPESKSFYQIMSEWCSHRVETVKQRLQSEIAALLKRIHILEGRKIVFLNLDEVIATIREADDPKPALMDRFSLSENQAEDILEIRLRQLARLELIKIENELNELNQKLNQKRQILDQESSLRDFVCLEIQKDAEKFGDDRRTAIDPDKKTSTSESAVVNEKITVMLSEKGLIKLRQGWATDIVTTIFKSPDKLSQTLLTESAMDLMLLSSDGRLYCLDPSKIPSGKNEPAAVSSIVQLQTIEVDGGIKRAALPQILFNGTTKSQLLVISQSGYGFKFAPEEVKTRNKTGKAFYDVKGVEDRVIGIFEVKTFVVILTSLSRIAVVLLDEISEMNKGRGSKILSLKNGEQIQKVITSNTNRILVQYSSNRGNSKEDVFDMPVIDRAGKPVELETGLKSFVVTDITEAEQ